MSTYTIRNGAPEDVAQLLVFIKELAEFEHALHEVAVTEAQLLQDGFGENPVYGFFIAEKELEIVGVAVYYFRYSTWKGKQVYLEDLVVAAQERGKGLGKLLFERVMRFVLETGSTGMKWQVLDWNEAAIQFYKKYNSRMDSEWIDCSLSAETIREKL